MKTTVAEKVRTEIAKQPGRVFTAADLKHLPATTNTLERTLARLAERGDIRRISRGLYHYPKPGKLYRELPPKPEQVAQTLAQAKGAKLVPSGAMALHRLGLTTQVPMKYVYLTNRSSRIERLGKLTVELKKVSERRLSGAGTKAGEILSAIEYVGPKEARGQNFVSELARKMDSHDADQLQEASKPRAAWVRSVVEEIIKTWRSINELPAESSA